MTVAFIAGALAAPGNGSRQRHSRRNRRT